MKKMRSDKMEEKQIMNGIKEVKEIPSKGNRIKLRGILENLRTGTIVELDYKILGFKSAQTLTMTLREMVRRGLQGKVASRGDKVYFQKE
jgi:hypothetical protein